MGGGLIWVLEKLMEIVAVLLRLSELGLCKRRNLGYKPSKKKKTLPPPAYDA